MHGRAGDRWHLPQRYPLTDSTLVKWPSSDGCFSHPIGHVCSMQMTGHGAVEPTSLYEMIQVRFFLLLRALLVACMLLGLILLLFADQTSQKLGRELIEGLDKALAQEAKSALPKTCTSAYFN